MFGARVHPLSSCCCCCGGARCVETGALAVDFTVMPLGGLGPEAAPGVPWQFSPDHWSIVDVDGAHVASFTGGGEFQALGLTLPFCCDRLRFARSVGFAGDPNPRARLGLIDEDAGTLMWMGTAGWPNTTNILTESGDLGSVPLVGFEDGVAEFEWVLADDGTATLLQIVDGETFVLGSFPSSLTGDGVAGILLSGGGQYLSFEVGCRDDVPGADIIVDSEGDVIIDSSGAIIMGS